MTSAGLHHVTAIAGPVRRNLDFYSRTLGLRLVKRTVNFDDPETYHLYFGDAAGSPGSILTFFPWGDKFPMQIAPARVGAGETEETRLRIPQASLSYWLDRLTVAGVPHAVPDRRFGRTTIAFEDPDGMRLRLVAVPGAEAEEAWAGGEVPGEHAIRGIEGVSLRLRRSEATARVLTEVFGWAEVAQEGAVRRFAAPGNGMGAVVDLHEVSDAGAGRLGTGTVHHIAFRAADDAAQAAMVEKLVGLGLGVTEQRDRNYFRSVYFREPGGVLFEIATDDPGFAVDEAAGELGTALKLPSFLEGRRTRIEEVLPALA